MASGIGLLNQIADFIKANASAFPAPEQGGQRGSMDTNGDFQSYMDAVDRRSVSLGRASTPPPPPVTAGERGQRDLVAPQSIVGIRSLYNEPTYQDAVDRQQRYRPDEVARTQTAKESPAPVSPPVRDMGVQPNKPFDPNTIDAPGILKLAEYDPNLAVNVAQRYMSSYGRGELPVESVDQDTWNKLSDLVIKPGTSSEVAEGIRSIYGLRLTNALAGADTSGAGILAPEAVLGYFEALQQPYNAIMGGFGKIYTHGIAAQTPKTIDISSLNPQSALTAPIAQVDTSKLPDYYLYKYGLKSTAFLPASPLTRVAGTNPFMPMPTSVSAQPDPSPERDKTYDLLAQRAATYNQFLDRAGQVARPSDLIQDIFKIPGMFANTLTRGEQDVAEAQKTMLDPTGKLIGNTAVANAVTDINRIETIIGHPLPDKIVREYRDGMTAETIAYLEREASASGRNFWREYFPEGLTWTDIKPVLDRLGKSQEAQAAIAQALGYKVSNPREEVKYPTLQNTLGFTTGVNPGSVSFNFDVTNADRRVTYDDLQKQSELLQGLGLKGESVPNLMFAGAGSQSLAEARTNRLLDFVGQMYFDPLMHGKLQVAYEPFGWILKGGKFLGGSIIKGGSQLGIAALDAFYNAIKRLGAKAESTLASPELKKAAQDFLDAKIYETPLRDVVTRLSYETADSAARRISGGIKAALGATADNNSNWGIAARDWLQSFLPQMEAAIKAGDLEGVKWLTANVRASTSEAAAQSIKDFSAISKVFLSDSPASKNAVASMAHTVKQMMSEKQAESVMAGVADALKNGSLSDFINVFARNVIDETKPEMIDTLSRNLVLSDAMRVYQTGLKTLGEHALGIANQKAPGFIANRINAVTNWLRSKWTSAILTARPGWSAINAIDNMARQVASGYDPFRSVAGNLKSLESVGVSGDQIAPFLDQTYGRSLMSASAKDLAEPLTAQKIFGKKLNILSDIWDKLTANPDDKALLGRFSDILTVLHSQPEAAARLNVFTQNLERIYNSGIGKIDLKVPESLLPSVEKYIADIRAMPNIDPAQAEALIAAAQVNQVATRRAFEGLTFLSLTQPSYAKEIFARLEQGTLSRRDLMASWVASFVPDELKNVSNPKVRDMLNQLSGLLADRELTPANMPEMIDRSLKYFDKRYSLMYSAQTQAAQASEHAGVGEAVSDMAADIIAKKNPVLQEPFGMDKILAGRQGRYEASLDQVNAGFANYPELGMLKTGGDDAYIRHLEQEYMALNKAGSFEPHTANEMRQAFADTIAGDASHYGTPVTLTGEWRYLPKSVENQENVLALVTSEGEAIPVSELSININDDAIRAGALDAFPKWDIAKYRGEHGIRAWGVSSVETGEMEKMIPPEVGVRYLDRIKQSIVEHGGQLPEHFPTAESVIKHLNEIEPLYDGANAFKALNRWAEELDQATIQPAMSASQMRKELAALKANSSDKAVRDYADKMIHQMDTLDARGSARKVFRYMNVEDGKPFTYISLPFTDQAEHARNLLLKMQEQTEAIQNITHGEWSPVLKPDGTLGDWYALVRRNADRTFTPPGWKGVAQDVQAAAGQAATEHIRAAEPIVSALDDLANAVHDVQAEIQPPVADAPLPDWMKQNMQTLASSVDPRIADQIESLAAQRKTAGEIAAELGVGEDQIRAVRFQRNIPSMTSGAGLAQTTNPEFESWLSNRTGTLVSEDVVSASAARQAADYAAQQLKLVKARGGLKTAIETINTALDDFASGVKSWDSEAVALVDRIKSLADELKAVTGTGKPGSLWTAPKIIKDASMDDLMNIVERGASTEDYDKIVDAARQLGSIYAKLPEGSQEQMIFENFRKDFSKKFDGDWLGGQLQFGARTTQEAADQMRNLRMSVDELDRLQALNSKEGKAGINQLLLDEGFNTPEEMLAEYANLLKRDPHDVLTDIYDAAGQAIDISTRQVPVKVEGQLALPVPTTAAGSIGEPSVRMTMYQNAKRLADAKASQKWTGDNARRIAGEQKAANIQLSVWTKQEKALADLGYTPDMIDGLKDLQIKKILKDATPAPGGIPVKATRPTFADVLTQQRQDVPVPEVKPVMSNEPPIEAAPVAGEIPTPAPAPIPTAKILGPNEAAAEQEKATLLAQIQAWLTNLGGAVERGELPKNHFSEMIPEQAQAAAKWLTDKYTEISTFMNNAMEQAKYETNKVMLDYATDYGFDMFLRNGPKLPGGIDMPFGMIPFERFATRNVPFWFNAVAEHPAAIRVYTAYQHQANLERKSAGLPEDPVMAGWPIKMPDGSYATISPANIVSAGNAMNFADVYIRPGMNDWEKALTYIQSLGLSPSPSVMAAMQISGATRPDYMPLRQLFPQTGLMPGAVQRWFAQNMPDVAEGLGWTPANLKTRAISKLTQNAVADMQVAKTPEEKNLILRKLVSTILHQDSPEFIAAQSEVQDGDVGNRLISYMFGIYPSNTSLEKVDYNSYKEQTNFILDELGRMNIDTDTLSRVKEAIYSTPEGIASGFARALYPKDDQGLDLPATEANKLQGATNYALQQDRQWRIDAENARFAAEGGPLGISAAQQTANPKAWDEHTARLNEIYNDSRYKGIDNYSWSNYTYTDGKQVLKPEAVIADHYGEAWLRLLNTTKPRYEAFPDYKSWADAVGKWKNSIPELTKQLWGTVKKAMPVFGDAPPSYIGNLTSADVDVYAKKTDPPQQALLDVWRSHYEDGYYKALENKKGPGYLLAKRIYQRDNPAPSVDKLIEWLKSDGYSDRFDKPTLEKVIAEMGGIASIQDKQLAGKTIAQQQAISVDDLLGRIPPGKAYTKFLNGMPESMQTLYQSYVNNGYEALGNENKWNQFVAFIQGYIKDKYPDPSIPQLQEWSDAYDLNEQMKIARNTAIPGVSELLTAYNEIDYNDSAARRAFRNQHPEIAAYYNWLDQKWSPANPLWVKYYGTDSTASSYASASGARSSSASTSRRRSGGGGGGGVSPAPASTRTPGTSIFRSGYHYVSPLSRKYGSSNSWFTSKKTKRGQ